jgi:crotonobetainyl-CoA:carnitine CoA-transferase CaiB-like acyl-CoA transferase
MIVEVDHPKAGKIETIGHPVKFSRTPASIDRAAPLLGQHTREVLVEFGYDTAQIEALIRSRAVIAT